MAINFYGSYNELSKIIKRSGYLGAWNHDASETKPAFRFNNGAILNWWKDKGTINFQGPIEAREEVKAALVPHLLKKHPTSTA
jgi:hypothetical protein